MIGCLLKGNTWIISQFQSTFLHSDYRNMAQCTRMRSGRVITQKGTYCSVENGSGFISDKTRVFFFFFCPDLDVLMPVGLSHIGWLVETETWFCNLLRRIDADLSGLRVFFFLFLWFEVVSLAFIDSWWIRYIMRWIHVMRPTWVVCVSTVIKSHFANALIRGFLKKIKVFITSYKKCTELCMKL